MVRPYNDSNIFLKQRILYKKYISTRACGNESAVLAAANAYFEHIHYYRLMLDCSKFGVVPTTK